MPYLTCSIIRQEKGLSSVRRIGHPSASADISPMGSHTHKKTVESPLLRLSTVLLSITVIRPPHSITLFQICSYFPIHLIHNAFFFHPYPGKTNCLFYRHINIPSWFPSKYSLCFTTVKF